MQIVEQALFPPGHCALSGRSDGPFVDTGAKIIGQHIYLHVDYVKNEVAPLVGLVEKRGPGRPKKGS